MEKFVFKKKKGWVRGIPHIKYNKGEASAKNGTNTSK